MRYIKFVSEDQDWARLIFGLLKSHSFEWDRILKILLLLNLIRFCQKNPGRVKNERYFWNGEVVYGNEQYVSFILIKYKHEQ